MVKVHSEKPPPIGDAASAAALPSTPYSAMGRKLFIGGNWKCNGTVNELMLIIDGLNSARVPATDLVDLVVSPPFVFLHLTMNTLRPEFQVAAQNCWVKKGGPYTGEISAEMLVNVGVKWVIIGHSERRALMGETNEFVGEKVAYALSQGLKIIACVGENLEQRESGSTMEVIAAQVKAIADRITDWTNVVIAYEPVWAVGTDKVASSDQAQEVHSELRKWLHANTSAAVAESTRIIYGGCVNADNCKELGDKKDVDGFLVGEASLTAEFYQLFDSLELVNELQLPSDTVEKIAYMKLAELAKVYSDVEFEFDADAAQKDVADILKRIEKKKMSHTELLDDLNFRISSAKTEVTLSVRARRDIFSQFDELSSVQAKVQGEKELADSLGVPLNDRDGADERKIPGMIKSLISRIKKWENRHGSDVVNSDGIRLLTILEGMVEQENDPDFNPEGESETESDDMKKYVVAERGLKKG